MRAVAVVAVGAVLGLAGMAVYRAALAAMDGTISTDGAEQAGNDAVDELLGYGYELRSSLMGKKTLSLAGLSRLESLESFSAVPYRDQAGYMSIGFGHKIKPGESLDYLDRDAAASLLGQDVGEAEDAVNALVSVQLTQPQFDALVIFVFNVGVGAFRRSTLLQKLNSGQLDAVPSELQRWRFITLNGDKVESAGLVNRRAAEIALWSTSEGGYTA